MSGASKDEGDNKVPNNFSKPKKSELQQECLRRAINTTEHDARGNMMRKIRVDAESRVMGTTDTLMGFGKHADLQYGEVVADFPGYAK